MFPLTTSEYMYTIEERVRPLVCSHSLLASTCTLQVSEYDFFRNYFGHLYALAQGTVPLSGSASESGSSAQVGRHST